MWWGRPGKTARARRAIARALLMRCDPAARIVAEQDAGGKPAGEFSAREFSALSPISVTDFFGDPKCHLNRGHVARIVVAELGDPVGAVAARGEEGDWSLSTAFGGPPPPEIRGRIFQ